MEDADPNEITAEARHEPRPILIVEDDEAILWSIKVLLEDEGYLVVTALNGEEALEWMASCVPGLILLDMKMPVMDGWAFARAYRARPLPHAPLIAMTASRDRRDRAGDIGADGYLTKPFDVEQLLELVHKHVEQ